MNTQHSKREFLTVLHSGTDFGMCHQHIAASMRVASEKRAIIISRVTNPIGLELIRDGYLVKGLKIKHKSSDWGPQAGFIPEDQELSKTKKSKKIDFAPGEIITNMSKNNYKQSIEQLILPSDRSLMKSIIFNGPFEQEYPGTYIENNWFKLDDKNRVSYRKHRIGPWKKLKVICYTPEPNINRQRPCPVTADYDLFGIFPHYTSKLYNSMERSLMRTCSSHESLTDLGNFSKTEYRLSKRLNDEFHKISNNKNRDLIMHGPETRNPHPCFDDNYLLITPNFKAFILPQDKLLKAYYEMTKFGYYVYPNLKWEHEFRKEIWTSIAPALHSIDYKFKVEEEYPTIPPIALDISKKSNIDGMTIQTFYKDLHELYIGNTSFGPRQPSQSCQSVVRQTSVPFGFPQEFPQNASDPLEWTYNDQDEDE